ncbi:hypothetical protein [Streptomyces sp. NPDC101178]|uniref:hypothetical protein n=1 Tax=Streptomyces sp. NPDC101178 TaxID=3366124 RepID=UPI0038147EF1
MDVVLDEASVKAQIRIFLERYYAEEKDPDEVKLGDLDSFTLIQLLLHIEDAFDIVVLEELHNFRGGGFDEFSGFVVQMGTRKPLPTP